MREDLRRDASDIWVIDCSPEGHQPDVAARLFPEVQHPICIVLAARAKNKPREVTARLHVVALPRGRVEAKFEALATLSLNSPLWLNGEGGWRDPFVAEAGATWVSFPELSALFTWSTPGVKTHRTWVIAPDKGSLAARWDALTHAKVPRKKALFHEDASRTVDSIVEIGLGDNELRTSAVVNDSTPVVVPVRYAFRTLDRQWIIPDHRLISRGRPRIWSGWSDQQLYLTALEAHAPTSGPAISFSAFVPDQHHYKG